MPVEVPVHSTYEKVIVKEVEVDRVVQTEVKARGAFDISGQKRI